MKTTFSISVGYWTLVTLAMATPDQVVSVQERLLGSNENGFVTLRTENDNLGSYFSSRSKRFLVEYSKQPSDSRHDSNLGAEIRSTLLLDSSSSDERRESGQQGPGRVTQTVKEQDREVKLAALLLQFPHYAKRWTDEQMKALQCDPTGGVYLGPTNIVWGGWITQRFVGDPNAKLDWQLEDVFEDGNALYFSVSVEDLGQRLVAIPPRKTQQVRDQLSKQTVYLVAGSFKAVEEAVQSGRELIEKSNGKFKPEVWSVGRWSEEMQYVVADSESARRIERNEFKILEALTGVDFTVMDGKYFTERTVVTTAK